eukprot:CAMPEP_0174859310 /NCGR_PEP_ID=MMETSP1114-20130205/46027_1 /TAXON_ID=312471 /ORGANISM="Neobodo designis, Strain CCAP 1951/1" /LENGTH=37 /DNA_ID= /DNA_START= /DNA_END= /DNA_ORIENTATION=
MALVVASRLLLGEAWKRHRNNMVDGGGGSGAWHTGRR